MRALYGVSLATGAISLVVWVVAPARPGGRVVRMVIGALVGLGMAGLSASYAGWPAWGAAVAGLAAASLAGWWAGRETGE